MRRNANKKPIAVSRGNNDRARNHPSSAPQEPFRRKSSDRTQRFPFPVVGIGASAGGLEALLHLFGALPAETGMAFIVVQHLSPISQNILPGLLSQVTNIPVCSIRDTMPLSPDTVFVATPGSMVSVTGKTFGVSAPESGATLYMPIDHLFYSLAEDLRERAIGIILSGTNNDGTAGLKTIREKGGITLVQDERSAKCKEMPRSASRFADVILAPELMAARLVTLREHSPGQRVFDPEQLADLFAVVRKGTDADFSTYKHTTVVRRISRRMLFKNIPTLKDYVALLKSDPDEVERLYQDLLINVTGFFRDRELFTALREKIVPGILKKKKDDEPVRVWVAGCSSGEEAYSLAMLLAELLGEKEAKRRAQIFATDINEQVLKKARAGRYRAAIEASVSRERLKRFFTRTENGYQVNKTLRGMCTFVRHNLLQDPPFSRLDLLTCRNLLIYLAPPLQKKVLSTFRYALHRGGFLALGSSETIAGLSTGFVQVDKKNNIHLNEKTGLPSSLEFMFPRGISSPALVEENNSAMENIFGSEFDMRKEVDSIILDRCTPPGIVVNEGLEVIQFRGHTGKYLEHVSGKASFQLTRVLRPELIPHVHAALNKAKKSHGVVRSEKIALRREKQAAEVTVEVIPVNAPRMKGQYFLILFTEGARIDRRERGAPGGSASCPSRLEKELASMKEYLQIVIDEKEKAGEELKSAYEEIQSSNEELRSTNEELETSKEELQSANEELTTVNEELQSRNAEAIQANNDLTNLLRCMETPIVVLGRRLNIRHFTPSSEKLLSLIPSDIGRPFSDINHRMRVRNLPEQARSVIATLEAKEQEIQDAAGQWHLMRIRPYFTPDGNVEGAVLVFFNIHAVKQAEEVIQDLARIPEENPNPVLRIAEDGTLLYANKASSVLLKTWGCQTNDAVPDEVRATAGQCLTSGRNREVEITCGDIRYSLIFSPIAEAGYVNVYGRDVTERRRAEEALRESEKKYRSIFENAAVGMFTTTLDGKIITVNSAVASMTGYGSPEEMKNQVTDLARQLYAHPEDRARFVKLIQTSGGRPITFETWVRRKDGSSYLGRLDAWLVHDREGNATHLEGFVEDITERRRAEEALRESEERYRSLFEGITEGFAHHEIICNENGEPCDYRFLEINPSFERLTGLKRQDVIGKTVNEALPGNDSHWVKIYGEVALTGKPIHFENYSSALNKYYEVYAYSPAPRQFATLFMDITERRRMEEALRKAHGEMEQKVRQRTVELAQSNERLRHNIELLEKLFSSTNIAIAYVDTKFSFIKVNQAYADACQHPPEFFVGKNHFELYPHPENEQIFKDTVASAKTFVTYAKPFVFPDHPEWGVTYWDWNLIPVKDSAGKVEGLLFCLVDVTKRKLAEEELLNAQKQLDEAKRLSDIGTLAATVAHELRNPLAAINVAASNIKRKAQNPALSSHLLNIEKKVNESNQIITNLLFYSRIRPPQYEEINLSDILSECVDIVLQRFPNKKITIQKKYEVLRNIPLRADPLQLKEVFNNILNNAYDAVPDASGAIEIETGTENGQVTICIRDNGTGIPEALLPRVFDPFFTTKAKGTGLGLSVCQQMVNLHGGTVLIESKVDKGTEVFVRIPRR